jgi:hypothetical protein
MRLRLKMRRVDDMEYVLMVREKQVCIASLQPVYTLPLCLPAFQKETGEMR